MSFRRVLIPVVLLLTLLAQFVPGTAFSPRPVAADSCDVAQFIADVTIPDGSTLAPGSTFVKTWRLKNIGSCTWTTSYAAVFTGGDQMGAPAVINMPGSVAPGATVDISVNLTAPSVNGHFRGNWKLRNASGGLFGIGAGNFLFWVDIFVNSSSTSGTTFDFVANYCSALWASGAGGLPCPGTDGNVGGFVIKVDAPQLETGSVSANPGLVVNPQQVAGGFIKGYYPAYTVQSGDHFQSIVNCAFTAPNCYVNFRLDYQIGGGPVNTFWSFNERFDGLFFPVNLDLSSLAGQSVNFILYTADVSGHGTPSGDRALWVGPKITGSGSGSIPLPPPSVCDRGSFVGDVTIPDGTVVAPGAAFTKTWRVRNVGSCTWTTSYALVFVFGNVFGASPAINLPATVAPVVPGATADFSVNMVAPTTPGHYRSYWRFRNASGNQFGVGSGMVTFFADINVAFAGLNSSTTTITSDTPDPSTPGQSVAVGVTVSGAGVVPTGTVSITGADSNCTLTLSGGSGSCNVVFNSAGVKTLTAVYSGDPTYTTSSSSVSHSVGGVGTIVSTTAITADNPDPSAAGQSVAISVTVSGSSSVPTGTVAISGADTNCNITLSGGSGSCNVVFNTTGTKTLTAAYGGDAVYATSSGSATHTVGKGSAATTITADAPDPSTPSQAVAVSVTVSGAGATPTGTVVISGADTGCTITLASGSGTCNVIFSSTGAKTLTATYNGDGNYNTSSGTASHTVAAAKSASATAITADTPDPSIPGQAVVVNVTVSGAGLPVPSGTVDITGADSNCSILLAAGTGSCSVTFNTTGAKTLIAVYNGDGNFNSSSGSTIHTVIKGSTTTSITAATPEPSIATQAITVSVSVIGAGVTPTGSVDISGADINCTITLSAGSGTCGSVVFNTIGAKTLTATYNGDTNYLPSTATAAHTVQNASTTTFTSDLPDPSVPGDAVMVSVNVAGTGVAPTGTVDITGADINCTITLFGGTGTCPVLFTSAGAKTLVATYNGDGNYVGSTASSSHAVNKGVSVTAITGDTPNPSLANQSVTITVNVAGAGVVPTGTVAISISGAPSTCTVTLAAGAGSCNIVFTSTGSYTITATYSGDGNYLHSLITTIHTVN